MIAYEVVGIKKEHTKKDFKNTKTIKAIDEVDAIKKYVELTCKNDIEYKSYKRFLIVPKQ